MSDHNFAITKRAKLSFGFLILLAIVLFFTGCNSTVDLQPTIDAALESTMESIPTATAIKTFTAQPTYTELPTLVPLSTYTSIPTATLRPTYTKQFTFTPLPSLTARPTYTPLATLTDRPTYTPLATLTNRPTYTPLATLTKYPTYTPLPTLKPLSTYTPFPTQTKLPTYTALPTLKPLSTYTPAPTFTLPPTFTPRIETVLVTPTTDESILKADKTNGFYLIGPEIAPGVWRTENDHSKCYWKISDIKGSIVSNYLGMGGGTIYIPSDAYQIEIQNCGNVTFVQ